MDPTSADAAQNLAKLQQELLQATASANQMSARDLKVKALALVNLAGRRIYEHEGTREYETLKDLSTYAKRIKNLSDRLENEIAAKVSTSSIGWIKRQMELFKKPPEEIRAGLLQINKEILQYNAAQELQQLPCYLSDKQGVTPFSAKGLNNILLAAGNSSRYFVIRDPENAAQFRILGAVATKPESPLLHNWPLRVTAEGQFQVELANEKKNFSSLAGLQEFLKEQGLSKPAAYPWKEAFIGLKTQEEADQILKEKQQNSSNKPLFAIHESKNNPGYFKLTYYDQNSKSYKNQIINKSNLSTFEFFLNNEKHDCSSNFFSIPFTPIHGSPALTTLQKLPFYQDASTLTRGGKLSIRQGLEKWFNIDSKGYPTSVFPPIPGTCLLYPHPSGEFSLAVLVPKKNRFSQEFGYEIKSHRVFLEDEQMVIYPPRHLQNLQPLRFQPITATTVEKFIETFYRFTK